MSYKKTKVFVTNPYIPTSEYIVHVPVFSYEPINPCHSLIYAILFDIIELYVTINMHISTL